MRAGAGAFAAVAVLAVSIGLRRQRLVSARVRQERRWRLLVVGAAVGVLAAPWLGVAVVVGVAAVDRRRQVIGRRRVQADVAAAVPEVVDLFRLAVGAGLPVPAALGVVAGRSPPAVRPAMVAADRRRRRGLPIADALDHLADGLGAEGAELVALLRQAALTGTPLTGALGDLAARRRAERWSQVRAAAGRLTVSMLFPLVLCILPAALALAVVPLIAVSLEQLSA